MTAADEVRERSRLAGLDGIRGIAALFVMLHHCWLLSFPGYPADTGPGWAGWLLYGHFAVVVFIVLSGFSLAVSPARSGWRLGGLGRFAQRRAWRILPPYWAALAVSLVIAWAVLPQPGEGAPTAKSVLVYGLLVQDLFGAPSPNGAFWSIAIEAQLYLVFPLMLLVLSRYGAAVMLGAVTTLVVAIGALAPQVPAVDLLMRVTPQFAALFAAGMVAAGVLARNDPALPGPVRLPRPDPSRPTAHQPGHGRPGHTRPTDTQPGDTQPGDTQPGDTQPGDTQPGDTQPGHVQLGGCEPGSSQVPGPALGTDAVDGKPPQTTPSGAESAMPGAMPAFPAPLRRAGVRPRALLPWLALAAAVPALALVVVQGSVWTVENFFWVDLALGPCVALLLAALATGRPASLVRLLDLRPIRRLGSFSYSLYLTHAPFVVIVSALVVTPHVPPGVPTFLATLGLSAPLTIAVAWAFAAVFEFPFQRHRSWTALRAAIRDRLPGRGPRPAAGKP